MAFAIAARWLAKEGQGDAVASGLGPLVLGSRAEPGVILYQPLRDPLNPDAFFMFEIYVDKAAWDVHHQSPHVVENRHHGVGPLLEINEPTFYETIDI
jgi:quinol monooxygenase YgiN